MSRTQDVIERFAAALDGDNFEVASALLSGDCRYESPTGPIIGPVAITDSYRSASEWARTHLDEIIYESQCRLESANRGVVLFVDHLRHNGQTHSYRCQQFVTVDAAGQITRIEHDELSGEREAVEAFLRKVGVERSAD